MLGAGTSELQDAREQLIVALDFPSVDAAMTLVDRLENTCRWFKVGMELYYAAGNSIVEQLRTRGFKVFLDLKLHDIPNTVAGAVNSCAKSGASMLTVHASGGEAMIRAAAEAADRADDLRLLAVTVLTSMDAQQLTGVGVTDSPGVQVLRLARLAQKTGIHGLVCSAEEVGELRAAMGEGVLLVVPGIRPKGTEAADQKRIATPAEAIARGASMLVVGRPITQSMDPARAMAEILEAMHTRMLSS